MVGTSVIPSSSATSFARNRAKGRPRRRSTTSLTMLRARTNTSAISIVRSAADSAYRTNSVRKSGEKRALRLATVTIATSAVTSMAIPARISFGLSRNRRLPEGGDATADPLARRGVIGVTVAGISNPGRSWFSCVSQFIRRASSCTA